jgi:hypothetical protein
MTRRDPSALVSVAREQLEVVPPSGKVLSGGVDSNALQRPKRFFGAARHIEGGGSMSPRRLRSSRAAPTTSGRYAGAPDSISCRTIPNAYMSLAAVAGSSRACSGLMCDSVPVMPPDCETKGAAVHPMGETVSPSEARRVVSGSVSPGSNGRSSAARGAGSAAAATCARPKSSTLTSPPVVTSTLPGFRSRCTIPAACVATRTSVICCASRSRPAVSRPSTA